MSVAPMLISAPHGPPRSHRPTFVFAVLLAWAMAAHMGCAKAPGPMPLAPPALPEPTPDQPPLLQPFADAEHWVVKAPLLFEVGSTKARIIVPAGFVTDLASIPRGAQTVLPRIGRYLAAAILHDYLYWNQTCERVTADRIFGAAMEDARVNAQARAVILGGVRVGGERAWAANREERQGGGLRVVPPDAPPPERHVTWPTYRERLLSAGARDADGRPDLGAACAAFER